VLVNICIGTVRNKGARSGYNLLMTNATTNSSGLQQKRIQSQNHTQSQPQHHRIEAAHNRRDPARRIKQCRPIRVDDFGSRVRPVAPVHVGCDIRRRRHGLRIRALDRHRLDQGVELPCGFVVGVGPVDHASSPSDGSWSSAGNPSRPDGELYARRRRGVVRNTVRVNRV